MRPSAMTAIRFACVLSAVVALAAFARADEKLQYNRDVRPILAENCFPCHGPDSAARKAKLRLDVREQAVEMGALTPGKPGDSEAITRVFLKDTDKNLMPPA